MKYQEMDVYEVEHIWHGTKTRKIVKHASVLCAIMGWDVSQFRNAKSKFKERLRAGKAFRLDGDGFIFKDHKVRLTEVITDSGGRGKGSISNWITK